MVVALAEGALELGSPGIEGFLRLVVEAKERHAAVVEFVTFRADGRCRQTRQPRERLECATFGFRVRPPVDVPPFRRRIRPDHDLQPLEQTIVARAVEGVSAQVCQQRARLNPAEDGDAPAGISTVPRPILS